MNSRPQKYSEVSAREAAESCSSRSPLIDIRSAAERGIGTPIGALCMSAEEVLERTIKSPSAFAGGAYILCAKGVRSHQLVQQLSEQGIDTFASVAGGYSAWADAGLEIEFPAGLNAQQADRYARHLVMPQVGPDGQQKLLKSRMLLLGLGGLNSPAALYLAAAGVGTLGLVDYDRVERSNLQRQIIHDEPRIGQLKIRSAAERITGLNPDTELILFEQRVNPGNAAALVEGWDVVIDGSDNFPARYALNEACVKHGIPLVYGAVMRFQGQVSVFWPAAPGTLSSHASPCFQCMFPDAVAAQDAPGCAEAGVLGILPGIVGTLQASEALKLVLGIGQPLLGRLLMFDALNMDFRQTRIKPRASCPCCDRGHTA
jgi:molybdopterin/thiamine biosynthesis adenylyltransferase/rhodanese-related sulfurtransferase